MKPQEEIEKLGSRLGKRLLLLLLAGVAVSYALLIYLIVGREKAILMEFNAEKSALLADSITANLTAAMIEKDPTIIRRMIDRHTALGGVTVAVFRNDGILAYGETDYRIPPQYIVSPLETSIRTRNEFIFLKPLRNEKACHACHNPLDSIRGIVAIKVSAERARKEADETAKRIILFAVMMGLVSGSGLIFLLRRMVLGPLSILKEGSAKIRDGDLGHRIAVGSDDELGALALTFNQMAEKIENAHRHLEVAVQKRTKDLRVMAELSMDVFRGDLPLKDILEKFLLSITKDLGYTFGALCLVDRETGLFRQVYKRGLEESLRLEEMTLAADSSFADAVRSAKPVIKKAGEILDIPAAAGNLAILPIISHQKKRCRDVNICTYSTCPAFHSPDERCWMIKDTLCRSPHSVKGKDKIYGCLHCSAFPVIGVMLAGSSEEIAKSSLHALEILASEIASAIDNYRLIDEKKRDIQNLIRLHDVSVDRIQSLQMKELTASIVSAAVSVTRAAASTLWLVKDGKTLHLQGCYADNAGLVPRLVPMEGSFIGRSIAEGRLIETINMGEAEGLGDFIEKEGFLYAALIPLKGKGSVIGCLGLFKKNDFFMSDSQKAIVTLFASHAASAINTARIYEAMKDEKEFSDAIFNSAASGVVVLDRDGTVIRINEAGSEILDAPPDRLVSKKIAHLISGGEEMLSVGPYLNREIEITLENGSIKPVGFANSQLRDKGGNERGVIVVFRDLTEIRKLQEEIKKKQHFDAIGKVVAGVAHEIRNPLFAVQSIGQILERDTESPQHQGLIQALLKETQRMRNLIEELLLYSRPSKLNIIDVGLETLWTELKEFMKVKDLQALLTVRVGPGAVIRGDKDKLTQIFLNLIENAAGAGASRIEVSAEETDGELRMSISDDGTGIKPIDMEKIFDPFFTTKKEGTGLGLPICRKIIEDHGGTIRIESAEGKGTTVVIAFKAG